MYSFYDDPEIYIEMDSSLKNHSDILIEANKYQRKILTKDEILQVESKLPKMVENLTNNKLYY